MPTKKNTRRKVVKGYAIIRGRGTLETNGMAHYAIAKRKWYLNDELQAWGKSHLSDNHRIVEVFISLPATPRRPK